MTEYKMVHGGSIKNEEKSFALIQNGFRVIWQSPYIFEDGMWNKYWLYEKI